MSKLFIEDLDLRGRRVLMRVDFNVPIENGRLENDKRLRATLPSIRHALERGASVVLMSHLGRPDGKKVVKYSLRPVAERLSELLGRPVRFLDDCVRSTGRWPRSTSKDTRAPAGDSTTLRSTP
jgi:phosphoglycerate kinase